MENFIFCAVIQPDSLDLLDDIFEEETVGFQSVL